MKKDRWFSCVTYTDEQIVRKVFERHGKDIRSYAYIVHDKDIVDYHIHVVLHTFQSYTFSSIKNWFRAVQDENDKRNTFVQSIIDRQGIIDYLTHKYESSEKFKYSEDDIHSLHIEDFTDNECKDDSYECLSELMAGASYRLLAKKYGKDFIYHFKDYVLLCQKISEQEQLTSIVSGLSESTPFTEDLNRFLQTLL